MKIKGVNKLENTINKFLAPFELTSCLSSDFSYEFAKDRVNFSLTVADHASNYFQDFIHSMWEEVTIDTFLISLLHEVGHAETWDDLEDEDIAYSDGMKKFIEDELAAGVTEARRRELYFEYFNLPDELAATTWAIEYIKNNAIQLVFDWEIISRAIIEFFKTNDIDFN